MFRISFGVFVISCLWSSLSLCSEDQYVFLLICLFEWYSEALGLAWLGFGPTLGIPMGPGRSSSLRIGGDSSVVSGSRRTGGESDRLAVVALRDATRNLLSPWVKARVKLTRLNTMWGRNI